MSSSAILLSLTRRLTQKTEGIKLLLQIQNTNLMASSRAFSTDNLLVEHDIGKSKFFIKLEKAEAKLEYVKRNENSGVTVLDMWHTEVPPKLQGKGIAKLLAKAAFDYVVDHKLQMQLSCTYLQKYYTDNPRDKYKEVIFKG